MGPGLVSSVGMLDYEQAFAWLIDFIFLSLGCIVGKV